MSSPESWLKSSPIAARCCDTRAMLAVASFTPAMFLSSIEPLHRVDDDVDDRAGRNVVHDDRNADGVVDRLEVLVEPFLGRLVVVGRHHQHGVGAGLLGVLGQARPPRRSNSSPRPRPPAPGPWPARCTTRRPARAPRATSVGLSPVVPTGTRPLVPSAICQSTRSRNAFSSTEPFLNGVTSAVNDPRNLVLAVMAFLDLRSAAFRQTPAARIPTK